MRLDISAPDFPQPAAQTVTGHRGCLEPRNYQSHPWVARLIVHPDQVQVLEAAAAPMGEAAANIRRAGEPMGSRQARRCRQEPPCFEGSETVSRFRPFFRRRDSTARPQRVAIRARNPCLLIRRLFRGRYDGFIPRILQSEPGKLAGRDHRGQAGADREKGRDTAAAVRESEPKNCSADRVDNVENVEKRGDTGGKNPPPFSLVLLLSSPD